ncbi:hypothetical protein SADUNF_Sadunf02G0056000 [Salix dunnii]|uniref:BZIP domain-containing protein n=1 Tax=Salix dunnii TaxID=1413687 RepID=A0A835TGG7_9ROSI|nr:hypothetical protein SADUNF_Sadunf02G0056000 [Salix dunnii]
MASSKVLTSSKPRNSDLSSTTSSRSRRATSSSATNITAKPAYQSADRLFQKESTMTVDGILRNVYASPSTESTLLDAQITLMESPDLLPHPQIETDDTDDQDMSDVIPQENKTADDIWREIVVGKKEMKDEPDEMMTLEDFLAKAGAVDVVGEDGDEVKMPPPERLSGGLYTFDSLPPSSFQVLDKLEGSIVGFGDGMEVELVAGSGSGGGRGKRGRGVVMEPLDKAAQQRQRRMIKNRESAARSRERKQAYQVELESLAVRLEEENEQLLKEKEEMTKERLKQLMEKVVPVVEKRRPRRALRRVNSLQCALLPPIVVLEGIRKFCFLSSSDISDAWPPRNET